MTRVHFPYGRPAPRVGPCGNVPRVTDSSLSPAEPPVWALPRALTDPRPAVLACLLGWVAAIVVALIVAGPSASVLPTCYAGLGVGALGVGVFLAQRAAARRGDRGAQNGLS